MIWNGIKLVMTRQFIEDTVGIFTQPREFKKKIQEGGLIPFWYGYGKHDFDTDTYIYYPVPFHFIIAFWEWFKFQVWWPFKTTIPHNIVTKGYLKGAYKAGLSNAFKVNYVHEIQKARMEGYKEAKDILLRETISGLERDNINRILNKA